MDHAAAGDAIAQFLLANDHHRADLMSTAPLERPVDIHLRPWEIWLRDGGHADSASYVGPLDRARITAAADARRDLAVRDFRRRGADREIDRPHLEALSQRAARGNERRCITLWVATMMWGSGMVDARAPWRAAQGLASDDLGPTLTASHRLLRAGDLAEAYRTASTVSGTGESYFTKWLWSASLGLPPAERQPLILDHSVRASLARVDIRPTRSAQGYLDYLEVVHLAAEHLRVEHGLEGATPEKLEWLLSRDHR